MPGPQLIHCSYHKCLTVYFGRVMGTLLNRCLPFRGRYRHFNSHLAEFLESYRSLRLASVNNRALDPDALGDVRITRFVRDPRDLVVSGYHYHRRGAEAWTSQRAPTADDWYFANGTLPDGLADHGGSFAEFLQDLPEEDGLLAEMQFRAAHFDSMMEWPKLHPRMLVLRYEDVLRDEEAAFDEIFRFYGFGPLERIVGRALVRRYALGGRTTRLDAHVRNPSSGQWREAFTPRLTCAFDERFPGLVEHLGYAEGT